MNRDIFFNAIRQPLFNGSLAQQQVNGITAILDACASEQVSDGRSVAYILATPMVETGGTFNTKRENLNYSAEALISKFSNRISPSDARRFGRTPGHPADQQSIANIIYGGAWGAKNLGNTQPNDGWDFRGGGLCQITGRANFARFARLLGIPLDTNPGLILDLTTAAKVMVVGMRDGLFTTKKLGDYFTPKGSDWVNARRIINALDRAEDIARDAQKFFAAIKTAA